MKIKTRPILVIALMTGLLAGCAGTTHSPKSAAQIESLDFKADTSPMPDCQPWIDKANDDDPTAAFILHMMYRDRIGNVEHLREGKPTEDILDAADMKHERVRWFNRAEESRLLTSFVGQPTLFYQIPDFLTTDEADNDAIAWLEEAAKRGYGNAEYVLGMLHWNGVIVPTDKDKAFELIRRAANHGIPNAQYHLGMIYELGLERNADQKLANAWLQQALDNGNKDAVFILSMKYADGIGVPKDMQKADDIEEKDLRMHPWTQIRRKFPGDFRITCAFSYDEGTPERFHESDCGDEEDYDPMLDDMTDEEREHYFAEMSLDYQADRTLDYGIDYLLASHWLALAAQDPQHIESRLQLTRVESADCRFDSDLDTPITSDILEALATQGYPGAKYMYAQYYKEDACESPTNAQTALDWYRKAYEEDGDIEAAQALADIYNEDYNYNCIIETLDIKEDKEKAYQYKLDTSSPTYAAYIAASIARDYAENNDNNHALEWYQKAIDVGKGETGDIGEYYLAIAKIYDTGDEKLRNTDKAFEYYKLAANNYTTIPTYERIDLIRLAMIYDTGTDTIKPNKKLAIEWYKRGIEYAYEFILNPVTDEGKLIQKAKTALTALPKIDLLQAVIDQVKLEEGKDPEQFFSIKSALKPCLESDRGEDDVCPMLNPLYDESIQKAITGIAAITLAKTGKLDKDIILNTYYELAILYGMERTFKEKLRSYSPVYKKIHDETYYELSSREGLKIYNIWYLRQIPYAAAEVFKTLSNTSKTWDDYMKEAKKAVESDEALKTGFGYDLTSPTPQPFQTKPE